MMKRLPVLALVLMLMLLAPLSLPAGGTLRANALSSASAPSAPTLAVRYFFTNACGACDDGTAFNDRFRAQIGEAADGVELSMFLTNTFETAGDVQFRNACRDLRIPESDRQLPMLIIGDSWLSGEEAIDARTTEIFQTEKARLLEGEASSASRVLYFYISPCSECTAVRAFMDELPGTLPVQDGGKEIESPVAVASWNVSDQTGLELVHRLFEEYGVPQEDQKTPIVFLRNGYLSGEEAIRSELVVRIRNGEALGTDVPLVGSAPDPLSPAEWPGFFLTGLVNGLNPCSISLLLFLFTLLAARQAGILKLGLSFLLGKAVAYLALGTVLHGLLARIDGKVFEGFQDVLRYALAAIAVIAAVFYVLDFLSARGEQYGAIRMQLPASLRKLNHQFIRFFAEGAKSGVLPFAMFALGAVVSVGEFLCTGQIYLAMILYMIERSPETTPQTIGALVVYVVGMMVPLAALTVAAWKGGTLFALSEFARRNLPWIKLLTAAVFVLFAVLLILLF